MRSFDDVRRKVITEDERRRRKVKPVKVIAEQQPSPELQDTRRRLKAAEEEISLLKKEREERQRVDSQPKPNWPPRQRPKCEFCGMLATSNLSVGHFYTSENWPTRRISLRETCNSGRWSPIYH